MKQTIRKSGYIFGLIAISLWSWNVIISRYLAPYVPPFQISFFRWFIAVLVLLPFTFKQLIDNKKILLKSWKIILILSFGLAFMNNFIYHAGHSTTAIDMALLATTGPIFMVIFSRLFLHISLTKKQILGFIITFFGVVFVISGGNVAALKQFNFAWGNLWMLAFAICFGLYGTFEKKRPQNIPQTCFLSITAFLATLILLPFLFHSLKENPLSNIDLKEWSLLIYLGIVNSIFGFLAWNTALTRIGSLRAGLLYYILPVLSSIEAYFVLNERVGSGEIIGAILVFCGVIIGSVAGKKKKKD